MTIAVVVADVSRKSSKRSADPKCVAAAEGIISKARAMGLQVLDTKGWTKVQNTDKKREHFRLSINRSRTTVYLVGFTLEHPSVEQISAERAKEEHIGFVRGELDLTSEELGEVTEAALGFLKSKK